MEPDSAHGSKLAMSSAQETSPFQIVMLIVPNRRFGDLADFRIAFVVQEYRSRFRLSGRRLLYHRDTIDQRIVHNLSFVIEPFSNQREQTMLPRILLHGRS